MVYEAGAIRFGKNTWKSLKLTLLPVKIFNYLTISYNVYNMINT